MEVLLYYMGKGKDEEKVRIAAERGNLPIPEWIKNKPELKVGLEFYYISFMELSTCRAIGMAEGPIPWTAMAKYAQIHNIEEFDRFTNIMLAMDNAYLTERSKK